MATVSTVATFTPRFETFDVRMNRNNTPKDPFAPIGRLIWDQSVVVAMKDAADVSELAISCVVPQNYAIRFTNISWQSSLTDADAVGSLNDWTNLATLTITGNAFNYQFSLIKANNARQATITNLFAIANWVPFAGTNWNRIFPDDFSTSGVIFRAVDTTADDTEATTFQSQMEALVYTVEQERDAAIHTLMEGSSSTGGTA